MAIVRNMWLRGVSKKVGGTVYYQQGGETRWRELAAAIKNPRTDAQMETRVKLANLVAFYRASSKWMRGAFESKPNNQSDYNAFVSANAASNNVYLTKSQVDAGNAIVAPYQVSRGSLGEITQRAAATAIYSNLYVGDLTITSATSVGQLSAALLNNNNGLQEGDQLSIIQYIQNTATDGNYTITCRAYEMILSLSDGSPIGNYLPVDLLTASADETPALGLLTAGFTGGVAFLLSRTVGGRILVSSSMVTLTLTNAVYPAMTTSTQKQNAIKSYGTNTVVFLDSNLAGSQNTEVTTAAAILAMTYDGNTYVPGSVLPTTWGLNKEITLIFSTPIDINDGASVTIYPEGISNTVNAQYNGSDLVGVSSVTFIVDEARNYDIVGYNPIDAKVELDTASTSGILYANYRMEPNGLE